MATKSTMLAGRSPPKGDRVSKRFTYARMTGKDLSEALREIDLKPRAFCRIFGVRPEVMSRWLKGTQDIATWVYPTVWLLREADNALGIVRTAAAHHVMIDHEHPEHGEFPFLNNPTDDEEDSP